MAHLLKCVERRRYFLCDNIETNHECRKSLASALNRGVNTLLLQTAKSCVEFYVKFCFGLNQRRWCNNAELRKGANYAISNRESIHESTKIWRNFSRTLCWWVFDISVCVTKHNIQRCQNRPIFGCSISNMSSAPHLRHLLHWTSCAEINFDRFIGCEGFVAPHKCCPAIFCVTNLLNAAIAANYSCLVCPLILFNSIDFFSICFTLVLRVVVFFFFFCYSFPAT